MYFILGLQLVATILIVVRLMKKLDYDPLSSLRQVYAVTCFIILTLSLGLPFVLNYLEPMTRSFTSWVAFYLISALLFLPDLIVQDKERTNLIRLSNYIILYYLVVYVPIFMFNISNTYSGFVVIVRTLVLIILFIIFVLAIRNVYKLIPDVHKRTKVSIAVWLVVILAVFFGRNYIALVDISTYDERDTYNVYFDDDFYVANDYTFDIEGLGPYIHDYAIDDSYIYLYTSDSLVQEMHISLIDKSTFELVKTYDFNTNDAEYTWYINQETDFIFNQDNVIYFPFIDGIYTINETGVTKISDISDSDINKFLYNGAFHISVQNNNDYEIYQLTEDALVLVDTITDLNNHLSVETINNYLVIKNTLDNDITVYPNTIYEVPADMLNYPIISVTDKEILLSNEFNILRLEFGGLNAEFTYYTVKTNNQIEQFTTDDYMFELRHQTFEESSIVYEVFPRLKTYDSDLDDLYLSVRYETDSFDSKEYSLNQFLVQKDNAIYFVDYETHDYATNQITVEINEVKSFSKTFDFGVISNFTRDSFTIALLTVLIYAGNVNMIPDKKRSKSLFQINI